MHHEAKLMDFHREGLAYDNVKSNMKVECWPNKSSKKRHLPLPQTNKKGNKKPPYPFGS